jgi:uroporphyrinogen-III decarboxylase
MEREYYHGLAARRLAMPIGADLVLSEKENPELIRVDGKRLGEVLVEAARRYHTPLAFPLMDLQIEKEDLLTMLGVAGEKINATHLDEDFLEDTDLDNLFGKMESEPPTQKMLAALEAIQRVAQEPDLIPMGMSIGPFSLLTKLIEDPITMIYQASIEDEDEEEAQFVHGVLEVATRIIGRWLRLQAMAGAKAICLCEPAANTVYLSPRQLESDPGIFDRLVIEYNKRLADQLAEAGVDLVFHDCGELIPMMIEKFQQLDPAILSLGSPVPLWEAVPYTSPRTVLFGNLPSKKFYSDREYPESRLEADAKEIRERMDATGHPYILGSECDVLSVSGCECAIHRKTELLLRC